MQVRLVPTQNITTDGGQESFYKFLSELRIRPWGNLQSRQVPHKGLFNRPIQTRRSPRGYGLLWLWQRRRGCPWTAFAAQWPASCSMALGVIICFVKIANRPLHDKDYLLCMIRRASRNLALDESGLQWNKELHSPAEKAQLDDLRQKTKRLPFKRAGERERPWDANVWFCRQQRAMKRSTSSTFYERATTMYRPNNKCIQSSLVLGNHDCAYRLTNERKR